MGGLPEGAHISVMVAAGRRTNGDVVPRSERRRRDGTRYRRQRVGRFGSVIVAVADVGPPQSIGRPHPPPAIVVAGVGRGRANECKATVAMMEEPAAVERASREPGRESRMRKPRACET